MERSSAHVLQQVRELLDSEPGVAGQGEDGADGRNMRVLIGVRDRDPLPRLPTQAQVRSVEGSGHALAELRRSRIRERRQLRRSWASSLIALVRGHGGTVEAHYARSVHGLRALIPARLLPTLARHPDVTAIERIAAARADGPDLTYLCTGQPSRADPSLPDTSSCSPPAPGADVEDHCVEFWNDEWSAVINAWPYIDAHLDGAGVTGGLASWATLDEWAYSASGVASLERDAGHLSLLILDHGLEPDHPAFRSEVFGEYRVRYFVAEAGQKGWSFVYRPEEISAVPPVPAGGTAHGTATAGAAMGSIVADQDSRVASNDAQQARSGRARRALAVFSDVSLLDTAERVGTGNRESAGDIGDGLLDYQGTALQDFDGVDIIQHAVSSNAGKSYSPGEGQTCPTNNEARGVNTAAAQVTWLYGEDSIVYVKSAGNLHDIDSRSSCSAGQSYEVSDPAGSPAAISVGASGGKCVPMTAAAAQAATFLNTQSAGTRTPDGRTYPMLVAHNYGCGNAIVFTDSAGNYRKEYGKHTDTSAASPTVSGAAVLFKHWYLANHGPGSANQPGRIISNLLNMADGFATAGWAFDDKVIDPPARAWGLGRFRMRFFDSGHMSSPWLRSTKTVTLTEDQMGDGIDLWTEDTGHVPGGARRLVVTLWWLEVNTGRDADTGVEEEKADVQATITVSDGPDAGFLHYQSADGDNKIRFQYDCYDTTGRFGGVPRGDTRLFIWATSLPMARRYPATRTRTVYVSWYWECGPDLSLIDCGSPGVDQCERAAPAFDFPEPRVLADALAAANQAVRAYCVPSGVEQVGGTDRGAARR